MEALETLNDLWIQPFDHYQGLKTPWQTILLTIAIPTTGGVLVALLCNRISGQRAHGIPETIKASHSVHCHLSATDGLKSALAAILSIGCGASVGQYGPLVHLGTTLGSLVDKWTGNHLNLKTISLGCGAAAAIATAFNAPLAGIVFAHEVILRHYSLRAFSPIALAAATGYFIATAFFERPALFVISTPIELYSHEYPFFILIGILGALIAAGLVRSLLFVQQRSERLPIPSHGKVALAGCLVGISALWFPEVLGVGKEVLQMAFVEGSFSSFDLGMLLIMKFVLTVLCLGLGFAGGIFSPSLLIGVLFGSLVGSQIAILTDGGHAALVVYAICGMVAVTSPVIGAPLTSILIIIELTHNYDLATVALISVVFSNLLGYRLFGRSIFDAQLDHQGFDISMGRDKILLGEKVISDYVHKEVYRCPETQAIGGVWDWMLTSQAVEAYVVDEYERFIGVIKIEKLAQCCDSLRHRNDTAVHYAESEKLVFYTDTSVWTAMEHLTDFIGTSIPVLDRTDNTFIGIVYEADIINAYQDTIYSIRDEEHAAG